MSEIEHVAIPLVYKGNRNPDMETEYKTAKEKLIKSLNEGFKIHVHATHTMVVLDVGYLVYVLVKEGGIK